MEMCEYFVPVPKLLPTVCGQFGNEWERRSEVSYSFLDKDVESPLKDDRPKLDPSAPEERSYYAYYVDDDENIGQQSDIVTVVVP